MISVIVPIYKVERFLPKCIESLMNQTFKDIEIILVDDGSPDKCPQICDEYAERDKRIKVIHQKNAGVSAARNAGLKIAKGDYIGFVDPDDWVAPEMYSNMINSITKEKVELAICGYDYYDENGNVDIKRQYQIQPDEVITQKEIMYRFSDMPPTIRLGVVNKLFSKNILHNQIFDEELHSAEDVVFLNDYVQKIEYAVVIHQPYYKNSVRRGSATHGALSIDSLADSFSAHNKMYEDIIRYYPDLKNHSLAFLLDVCVLKYDEAQKKLEVMSKEEKAIIEPRMKDMHFFIKKKAWQGILDREIYWKTRIYYLLVL